MEQALVWERENFVVRCKSLGLYLTASSRVSEMDSLSTSYFSSATMN